MSYFEKSISCGHGAYLSTLFRSLKFYEPSIQSTHFHTTFWGNKNGRSMILVLLIIIPQENFMNLWILQANDNID